MEIRLLTGSLNPKDDLGLCESAAALLTRVRVRFVGDQDRLAGRAGQAAGVWLGAGFQIWSSGLLACWQRRVVMALAPATVQCMPDSLRRWPMTALQPDSTAPEPTNRPRERNQW